MAMKHSDDIFSRTIWPWSLHPESPLLSLWEYIVVATVSVVCVLYPFRIVFNIYPRHITVTDVLISFVYGLDVVIQTLTSIEIGNGKKLKFQASHFLNFDP